MDKTTWRQHRPLGKRLPWMRVSVNREATLLCPADSRDWTLISDDYGAYRSRGDLKDIAAKHSPSSRHSVSGYSITRSAGLFLKFLNSSVRKILQHSERRAEYGDN